MEAKCDICKIVVASGPNKEGVEAAADRHQAKTHPVATRAVKK